MSDDIDFLIEMAQECLEKRQCFEVGMTKNIVLILKALLFLKSTTSTSKAEDA